MKKLQKNNIGGSLVVKSNELVQKSKYELSMQEQRILLYVISKVMPGDDEFKEYDFEITDLCEACGISNRGENYKNFRDAIQSLRDKSFWVDTGSTITLCSWIEKVTIYKNDTRVSIRLDEDLKPYLLQLKDNFTSYKLENALSLKSKYAIRLYELFKSYLNLGEYSCRVEWLRKHLMISDSEYPQIKDFRRRVLDKSIDEINCYTDINVVCESDISNRKVVGFNFTITPKDRLESVYAMVERGKRLNPKLAEADPDE